MFYLTIVNKSRRHCHSWLARQYDGLEDGLLTMQNLVKCLKLYSYKLHGSNSNIAVFVLLLNGILTSLEYVGHKKQS